MAVDERYASDAEVILSHRHDNGADLWTTPQKQVIKGSRVFDDRELPKVQAPKATAEKPSVPPAAVAKILSPEQERILQEGKMAAIESVKKVLDKAHVAFLTTVSGKQMLSRPMYMQKREFDGTLWFFAKTDSPKVEDVRKDSRVNVH
jgi:hypothetical protein